jgi:redox-sensitive bicupin YhaK (pirin superfamily)
MESVIPSDKILVRNAQERGHANHGWLRTFHTFSFADYFDPAHMGFRSLRVINDDIVAPRMGFPTHPHRDMEIFSYILEGALAHQDSLGNSKTLTPGQIQLMSAGSGVFHSEFNPSQTEPVRLLQIWITPNQRNLSPTYTEWHPDPKEANPKKQLVISGDGRLGSATIHQDASIFRVRLAPGESISHELLAGRGLWLQIASGSGSMNHVPLRQGDGAASEEPGIFEIHADSALDALLFDLN